MGVLLAFSTAEPARPITDHRLAFSMAEPARTVGRTDGQTNGFSSGKRRGRSLSFLWFFALRFVSRSWNPDPNCPSVEVLKPSVRLSRSWNPVSVSRGPETQVLRARHGRIVSDRHGYPLFLRTDLRLSVCRGPETQIPTVRLSRSWNPVSVYRGPETQVLRARHGRIVSDRHGYPLVGTKSSKM